MNTDIRRRAFLTGATLAGVGALAACTSNEEPPPAAATAPQGAQDAPGKRVTVGFAGPQADHGWLNAITVNARAEAQRHPDVELVVAEGSNDAATQSAQIDALINRKVDVLVVLPADG